MSYLNYLQWFVSCYGGNYCEKGNILTDILTGVAYLKRIHFHSYSDAY